MSTDPLTIRLFGPLSVLVRGEPLPRVRTRSVEWLLALLALRHGRAVSRAWLAGTLWPESHEKQALQNLRNSLMWLRQALGPEAWRIQSPSRDLLSIDLADAEVDLVRFDRAIQANDEEALREAVGVYSGPFLEGCYEEWVLEERGAREAQCLSALELLADRAAERGGGEVIQYLRRAEGLDPLRESVVRRLMTALAASGEMAAAVEVYRNFRNRLHDQMATAPDPETTRLFQEIRARARQPATRTGEGKNTLPVSSSPCLPLCASPLPHPLTALIGREQDVEEVRQLLFTSRLVTLVGAGGVGKTRLAIEVAAGLEANFAAGAAWVELAPLTNEALALTAIAAALGIRAEEGTEDEGLAALVITRLGTDGFLLALDNCEHVLDAAAGIVERLLHACGGLRVLATSRQRLGLAGEVIWHVPSLSTAEADALPEEDAGAAECALAYPAVRLFVERAAAARPQFRLSDRESAKAVCIICRRLDGIPLALELAAARVTSLTPGQIAARLDDRFALLTQGTRTALPRQKTLRALIDWSYELLTDAERAMLCRLSLFPDGWTLDAAEAILGSVNIGETEGALDLLASLADKSLILAEEHSGTLRYRMLETIRRYAAERLRESGEEEDARRCLVDWVLAMAERANGEMVGPYPDAALDLLDAEKENVREALGLARENADLAAIHLRLAGALWPFWEMRGHLPEGRAHLLGALEHTDLPNSPARAHALLGAAILLCEQDVSPETIACGLESLERFRALADEPGTASALLLLGHMGLWLLYIDHSPSRSFSHVETREFLSEGLALCGKLGWAQACALLLIHLGLIDQMEGDEAKGRALREEGWSLLDRGDDRRTPAYCLNVMNSLATTLYRAAGERALLERSIGIARRAGKKRREAAIVHALGKVAEWQSDFAFASECFQEATRKYREMGNEHALSEILQQLGNIYYRLGDYQSACPIYMESLGLFRKLGYPVDRAANNLGSTLFHLGDPARAQSLHREALSSYGRQIEGVAWSLERLGVVEAFHGEPRNATQILGAAASARDEVGKPLDPWDQDDWDRAVATVRAALGDPEFDRLYHSGFSSGWQLVVERMPPEL